MSALGVSFASTGLATILTLIAAINDLRSRRIPNPLIVFGFIAATALAFAFRGGEGLLFSLFGAATGFILLLPGFVLRFTGAGDVKLLSMLGAFFGPSLVLVVFVVSVVTASLFIVLRGVFRLFETGFASRIQRHVQTFRCLFSTGHVISGDPPESTWRNQRLPMAPFVAVGLVATLSYQFLQLPGAS